ncbi:SIR2 family protein [Lactobacillus crispatus]|uniref:SIR2 family protein n=1 Tax=Lactobacillus crispatus TaxID=47770 RepID=UPI0018A964CE|nr:SIR2 family protein [Lactobacillus crispatus]
MSTDKSLQNKYTEFKRNIRKAMKNNQLALFIGAGVSINSGMPSWQNAVETIGKRLGIEQVANTDFLKIPQYYYNANGKQAYNSLMQEIFKYRVELPISSIHKKLLKFNAQTIITTNYDKLIERASEEKGEIRHIICQDSDIPYIKNNKQLIKMHGDFDHDNFVLKEDDYLNYSSNFKLIENYVRSIIGSKVILFVGYSFNDPDLKQIFSWVKNILGKDMRKAYLINAENEYNENEANYYNNLGLDVIYVSAWDPKNFNKSEIDKNLEIALDRLLSNSEDTDLIERIYADLKKFEDLRYITTKYLNNTLAKYGLRISSDLYLQSIDNNSKNILLLLFSKQENIDNDKKRKITRIQNILSRSIIKGVILDKKVIEFKNSYKEDNWQKAFYTFDIPTLKK